ncbi:PAS domain-containing protein [Streptomyces yaizuensis]|uniref:PAS domain-containing protein n=1 Tax=Streptomyces yaizuensis TaxID=2989713 RepID=A0ABQ5P4B6_9ACTN|nr:PAS domain-containing protein [Streptomyces sp. YSPA8]GLF97298.1 PAS domain-containing protein [Streptomyces sp. YSPA8]
MSGSNGEPALAAPEDAELLAALLDGMDAALCAVDTDGVVTHWNREAERILGWSAREAVGRRGLGGWAARPADAAETERRLLAALASPGRTVDEFALLRKDGGRVLVRAQSARVPGADGEPAGVYCAFTEVHARMDLERSIALSEALFDDAPWGVVLVDVDLRPTVVNTYAARALGFGRTPPLGRPLGELLVQGVDELEGALHHVLAEGAPRGITEIWVALPGPGGEPVRRCWRCGFLRLASPLAKQPVPLGVGWLFNDVTEVRELEQEADRQRFRARQLHRAVRAAAEYEDPMEAATAYADFALAGFADQVLIDVVAARPGGARGDGPRLVRTAQTPVGAPGPCVRVTGGGDIPVRYPRGHPALQAAERVSSVRASAPEPVAAGPWPGDRQWPPDMAHALCVPLRLWGRTLGVLTFLRAHPRPAFERADMIHAESMAALLAPALDRAVEAGRAHREG